MQIASSAFPHRGIIPSRYTCEGENIHPPLAFSHVPREAKSLVLIIDDPDVPRRLRADGMWDHWILFNIPSTISAIAENSVPPSIPGKTTFGHTHYGGPCPPDREHRYFFKLYALDCELALSAGAAKAEVEQAMRGHILAQAELMGRYEKGKGY